MKNGDYEMFVKTLDETFNEKGRNCFIKIDFEGHEKEVIVGCQNVLKNNSCLLQIEISKKEILEEFYSLMHSLGYS